MAQPFNFTFGQDFFNAYQQSQRQKEEERQFNLKFGEEQRQRSLLDAFKQKDLELQEYSAQTSRMNAETSRQGLEADFTNVQKGDQYNQIGIPEGRYPNSLIDNWMQRNAPQKPAKMVEHRIEKGQNVETYFTPEGEIPSGKPFAIAPRFKSEVGGSEKDLTEPKLVGDINGIFQALKSNANSDESIKAPLRADLMARTESLMEASGLTEDVNHIWDIVKQGGDVEKAINIAALARKKSFTPKQRSYLRLYFKTRNPK